MTYKVPVLIFVWLDTGIYMQDKGLDCCEKNASVLHV